MKNIIKIIELQTADPYNVASYPKEGVYYVVNSPTYLFFVKMGMVYTISLQCEALQFMTEIEDTKPSGLDKHLSQLEVLEIIAVAQKPELVIQLGNKQ